VRDAQVNRLLNHLFPGLIREEEAVAVLEGMRQRMAAGMEREGGEAASACHRAAVASARGWRQ